MSESQISDIPRFKKLIDELKGMTSLAKIMPLVEPIIRPLGADTGKIQTALVNIKELEQTIQELSTIPDKFNDLFSSHGWIIYDNMNLEIAKTAIAKAEAGNITEAESDLINYYSPENIRWQLQMMSGIIAFRPRMNLAEKALIDYQEGRYHACVPVVLALLDGLVNELHDKRRGFFSEEADLQAWDSIAGHSKGLNVITKIFNKGRYKTTSEPIDMPYRNGILHGMDLGYDNQTVAAKCWAALFATSDWAKKAEQGELEAQPEEPNPTWRDLIQQIKSNEEDKAQLAAWKPRVVSFDEDMPSTGDTSAFPDNTPEQKLVEFLNYWKKNNYGYMAKCLSAIWFRYESENEVISRIREIYVSRKLKQFRLERSIDDAPAITLIKVRLWCEENNKSTETEIEVRLICENDSGDPAVRSKSDTCWRIMSYGLR